MYTANKLGSLFKKLKPRSSSPSSSSSLLEKLLSFHESTHAAGDYVVHGHHQQVEKKRARKGCVPLYVGEEGMRYEVPVEYLSVPVIRDLFLRSQRAEEEGPFYDFNNDEPLKIACPTWMFDQMLKFAEKESMQI